MAGIVMDSQQLSGDEKIFIKGYLNPLYPSEECVTHEPVVFYIREKNPAKTGISQPIGGLPEYVKDMSNT